VVSFYPLPLLKQPLSGSSELLEAMAKDNEQAFTTLYNANKSLVLKMIVALHEPKSHQTEDIMQDIFLTLWERRKKLVHIRAFECYLFIMVKNRLMTTQMKAKARQKALQQLADRTDWLYGAVIPQNG
jgi:DNA-directed RNA polymerase specialized sigma24 family protein